MLRTCLTKILVILIRSGQIHSKKGINIEENIYYHHSKHARIHKKNNSEYIKLKRFKALLPHFTVFVFESIVYNE